MHRDASAIQQILKLILKRWSEDDPPTGTAMSTFSTPHPLSIAYDSLGAYHSAPEHISQWFDHSDLLLNKRGRQNRRKLEQHHSHSADQHRHEHVQHLPAVVPVARNESGTVPQRQGVGAYSTKIMVPSPRPELALLLTPVLYAVWMRASYCWTALRSPTKEATVRIAPTTWAM